MILALAAASGCKGSADSLKEPTTLADQPSAAKAGDTPTAATGATAEDLTYDPAVLTIIVIDIDTKLAVICGIPESKVFFKYDSAKLLPAAKERLDQFATCVKTGAAKGRELRVIGRTDPVGSDEYNKQLGMNRADSVANYLREAGVAEARVETESKGEAAAAASPYGWPYDRRVTLRLKD